jgi:Helitron helicase-like domain at N-terminus
MPLSHLGVVDIDGADVTDTELMAHALANCREPRQEDDFLIRRGSAFVNEYARVDPLTGQRNDGGPSDTNHLLGSFPTLFPFGQGGFETQRTVDVPYEAHVRWALQYEDRRFRKDPHFPFQVFGVCQKRQVCRASVLQMKKRSYFEHQNILSTVSAQDLVKASQEETRGVPFSNPAVRVLRSQLSAVKTKVQGSDESRISIRSKIWGTNLLHNPPSLWVTINPSDTQDPIAQVLAGVEIDLDNFCKTAGPDSADRASNMASDPYASARFFHLMIETILEVLIGVNRSRNNNISRKEGIFGMVNSYVGAVEAQGRGSLHLHMLLWLKGAPTASELKNALSDSSHFRDKIKEYVKSTIRADLDTKGTPEVLAIPKVDGASYSRPLDPRKPTDVSIMDSQEAKLARTTQFHQCSYSNCLRIIKGRIACKRRAPFDLASDDWVDSKGRWGPKRTCAFLNNWNSTMLKTIRANHDVKLIMSGPETKTLTWYITNYAGKKQKRSSNVSALLAKRVAFHSVEEKKRNDLTNVNKRLIQRCANTLTRDREFSGPEIISYLMGWGDRFESHHYATIYTDAIMAGLKERFPGLRRPRQRQVQVEQTHGSNPAVETPALAANDEGTHIITMVSGVMTLKDQLHEYMFRGDEMAELNLFTFLLDTYDAKAEGGNDMQNTQQDFTAPRTRSSGRVPNQRVPYREGFSRVGRCRVFRTEGHETLPHLVGRWLPRNDRPNERELYCASVLALLKPWADLSDLKTDTETFDQSFQTFLIDSSKTTRDIIENIQYYYECYDGAKSRQDEEREGAERTIDYEAEACPEDLTSDSLVYQPETAEITEEDIMTAYECRVAMRERLYAEVAMNTATEYGVFSDIKAHTTFLPTADIADAEQMERFQVWDEQLKSVTRKEADGGGGGLFVNIDGAAPLSLNDGWVESVEARTGDIVEPHSPTSSRPKRELLNADQRRAHDIIEDQLKRRLRGNIIFRDC